MQILQSEAFDTFEKFCPVAVNRQPRFVIYVWLTFACALNVFNLGMNVLIPRFMPLTTVSTGGHFRTMTAVLWTFSAGNANTRRRLMCSAAFTCSVRMCNCLKPATRLAFHRIRKVRGFLMTIACLGRLIFQSRSSSVSAATGAIPRKSLSTYTLQSISGQVGVGRI